MEILYSHRAGSYESQRSIYFPLCNVYIFNWECHLLIGLDRFVAVVWPLRYKMIIACKSFWPSIITVWLLAVLLGVGHGFSYTLDIHTEYEVFLCALSFLQLILLATIYVILLRKAGI